MSGFFFLKHGVYTLVGGKHKRFQMLSECILAHSRIMQVSLARNSTPMGYPQRKPVRRWCLASSVEQTDLAVLMKA